MADTKINPNAETPFYKGSAVNSDTTPASRKGLQKTMRHSDEKLLNEFQKNEVGKKHHQDSLAALDQRTSPQIDTSALPAVAETIAFFEGKGKNRSPSLHKPKLTKPKLAAPVAKNAAVAAAAEPVAKETDLPPAAPEQKDIFSVMPTTTPAAIAMENAARAIENFFNDWFIKPFKQLFGLEELVPQGEFEVTPFTRFAEARYNEYMEKLEKELEKIQERAKEAQTQAVDQKSLTIFLRQKWIQLIVMQIKHQEEQIEAITDLVTQKQLMIQERQKKHCKTSETMSEKEEQLKPLEWINKAATATHFVAAGLCGAIFIASVAMTALSGGVLAPAAMAGIGAFSGIVGGVANVVGGSVNIRQADLNYDLNVLIGMLQKWQHEDECDTKEIEEEMQELTLKLESIQKHWEDLIYVAKMQHQVITMSMR